MIIQFIQDNLIYTEIELFNQSNTNVINLSRFTKFEDHNSNSLSVHRAAFHSNSSSKSDHTLLNIQPFALDLFTQRQIGIRIQF